MKSEEENVIKIGNYHRDVIRKFIPWFGKTEGEVIKELALRWVEANIANPNIIRIVEAEEVRVCKAQGCSQDSTTVPKTTVQENRVESLPERKDGNIASNPQGPSDLIIPKFAWDKTKEKNYDKLFFFEDGDNVMLSYMLCRCFVSKAAVLQIPFPVPYGYAPLKDMAISKRTGIRVYRKYLSEMGADTIHIDCASAHALTEREKKLKEAAEINAARWMDGKREMSARTKELRDGVVAKMTLGVGAEGG